MREFRKGQVWLYYTGFVYIEVKIIRCKSDYVQWKENHFWSLEKYWVTGKEFNQRAKTLLENLK